MEIENTHNRAGGCVWTPDQMEDVADASHELGMEVHVDGARIFNAAIALDIDVKEFMKHVDSMNFCLSKGLAAPVGRSCWAPRNTSRDAVATGRW